MPDQEILATLIDIIAETFRVNPARLSGLTIADDVDGWDSVSHAILIMNLEDRFGVELNIENTMQAENLDALALEIAAKVEAQ